MVDEYEGCKIAGNEFRIDDYIRIKRMGKSHTPIYDVGCIERLYQSYQDKFVTVRWLHSSKSNANYLRESSDEHVQADIELTSIDSLCYVFDDWNEYERVTKTNKNKRDSKYRDDEILYYLQPSDDYDDNHDESTDGDDDELSENDDDDNNYQNMDKQTAKRKLIKRKSTAGRKSNKNQYVPQYSNVSVYNTVHTNQTTVLEPGDCSDSDSDSGSDNENKNINKLHNKLNHKFTSATAKLQLSALPSTLPCRDEETQQISEFLTTAVIRGGSVGGLFIGGMPGTGKTACVHQVIRELKQQSSLPRFNFIEINGMKLHDVNSTYSVIYKSIFHQNIATNKACTALDKYFRTVSSKRICTIMLVDEIDYLLNKKQDVIYNLFDWTGRRSSRLCVVCIANTMNMPELLQSRVQSRMGLQRLRFKSYDKTQIQLIVKSRLRGLQLFDDSAIELCSLKVAAQSGDIRRALQICRRAIELCQAELSLLQNQYNTIQSTLDHSNSTLNNKRRRTDPKLLKQLNDQSLQHKPTQIDNLPVKPQHITQAIVQLQDSTANQFITAMSAHQKLLICALMSCTKMITGDASVFCDVPLNSIRDTHVRLCSNIKDINSNLTLIEYLSLLTSLNDLHIIRCTCYKRSRFPLVKLQVEPRDIVNALENDELWNQVYNG